MPRRRITACERRFAGDGDRDDLVEPERGEAAVASRRAPPRWRSPRPSARAPAASRPRRRRRGGEPRASAAAEPDHADEGAVGLALGDGEAEAVRLVAARLDPRDQGVAAARSSVAGKWRITSGSAFSAAKGARSRGAQRPQQQPPGLEHPVARPRPSAGGEARPRASRDVGLHLRDERADAVEAQLGPQEGDERDRELGAVEVAGEVEEIDLEVGRVLAEGRADADRGGAVIAAAVRPGQRRRR